MRGTSAEPARSTSRTAPRDSLMTRAMPRRLCPCSCSLRTATRVLWSSMAHLLLKTFCHTTGFLQGLPKTPRQLLTFSFQEILQRSLTKPPVRPSRDRAQRFDIGPQAFLETGLWWRCQRLLEGLQEKQRGLQQALACDRVSVTIGGIKNGHVPATQPERTNPFDQPKAGLLVGARQRNQILFGGMRHDLPSTHAFLNRFRQFTHQGQASADPTDRASEATRQPFQGQLESLLEFREQPALFQRRFRFARVPQPTHHQGFGSTAPPAEP